ncbi:MAG: prolyl oligopeptidase family serine peptidase [Proteobacteria bacterium]|nr:prolyl oligopeptidase family serine peptidase [Pseudomonadota bacterium]
MQINADSLLSITEKNFVREYHWTPDQKIEVADKMGVYGLSPQAFKLFRWNTDKTRFQALRSQELVYWQADLERKSLLARIPPSLGLQLEPRERWLSWISDHGDEQELQIFSRLSKNSDVHKVFRVAGFLRNVRWHPSKALMIYSSWETGQVPWESAQLYISEYDIKNKCPVPKLPRPLLPPQDTGAPFMSCAEAAFSPCGRFVIALLRTGEWFQFWSFDLIQGIWTQLSKAECEHAKPHRVAEQPQFALHPYRPILLGIAAQGGKHSFTRLSYAHDNNPTAWKAPRTRDTWLDQPRFSPDGYQLSVISASAHNKPHLRSWQYDEGAWYEASSMRDPHSFRGQTINPSQIQWQSIDGQTVHGILYRPKDCTAALPLIIAVHGGPVEQVSAAWPAKAKFFVELGFAFLYVNYRGSWGYGTRYQRALAGHWGIKDSDDVASAVPYLAAQGLIDPQRVGLWGGAAGGLTVLNILRAYPRLAQAAVAVHPYLDIPDLLERCSSLKRAELLWALGDCSVQEQQQRSPLYQCTEISTALALFHGAKDPLVPLKQIKLLKANMDQLGLACQLKIYENESHGWQFEETRRDYGQTVTDFFARYLLK